MKRILGLLTALAMLMTCCFGAAALAEGPGRPALTVQDIRNLNGGNAVIHTSKGHITFVGGTCASEPLKNPEAASAVVEDMLPLLGGDSRTDFRLLRTVSDSFGHTYYIFQQVYADMLVQGGAVKVITDREGNMLGLTASVISDLPEGDASEGISMREAEELVLEHERMRGVEEPVLVEGMTARIVLPVDREVDLEADSVPTRFTWVVCTTGDSGQASSDMPYLAHYVTLSGEYLYSLPTLLPGDSAAKAGYDAEYFFGNMESVPYTGYVDLSDGTEKEITVNVMRDKTTGVYYLGNPEHKIIVADCWEFLYNHGNVVPEASPDNREWDQVGLLSLYNYCRAYDYYRALGWQGGDGEETPIIILKDFCDIDHKPINNAAYAGRFYGWLCFLSSSANDFAQCLDIIAHEYTHCVTESLMTYNAYTNDFGAINEAISDIQGNICEMLARDTEDRTWIIGENSRESVRSMSEPHRFRQPDYAWDMYYQSAVGTPTDANDRGGVHSNSSLLNRVGYLLWEGGMSLEEGRAFWFALDCAMVPGTDYAQLKDLLPWVLKTTGLDRLQDVLSDALRTTRLGESDMPAAPPENQALLTLELPDSESFNDGKWMLSVLSVNTDALGKFLTTAANDLQSGKTEGYPEMLIAQFSQSLPPQDGQPADPPSLSGLLLDMILNGDLTGEAMLSLPEETPEELLREKEELQEFTEWLRKNLEDILYFGNGSAGQDGRTVSMMTLSGRAVPVLLYLDVMPNSDQLRKVNIAAFLCNRWIDLTPILAPLADEEHPDIAASLTGFLKTGLVFDLLAALLRGEGFGGFLKSLTCELPGGKVFILPSEGLDSVDLEANLAGPAFTVADPEVNNRLSRPKE